MVAAVRSFEPVTPSDLKRLEQITQHWLEDIFTRLPDTCGRYRNRLLLIALCQGGAQHYVDGKHGIKDLDVWAFFKERSPTPFPYRTVWNQDFGPSHLGRHPIDKGYTGRRVDLIGRSIEMIANEEPMAAVRRWLSGRAKSAQRLAERPLIGLGPANFMGSIIWQPMGNSNRLNS